MFLDASYIGPKDVTICKKGLAAFVSHQRNEWIYLIFVTEQHRKTLHLFSHLFCIGSKNLLI